jgi:hypothetical protein
MSIRLIAWIGLAALAVSGCQMGTLQSIDTPTSPLLPTRVLPQAADITRSPIPTPTPRRLEGAQVPETIVQMAIDELASRLSVDASAVKVVSASAVMWRDGSLGCPEPGVAYIQVLIEGYQIILEHAGQTYDYRSDGRYVRLCDPTPPIDPDVGGQVSPAIRFVGLAMTDLAQRLGVAAFEIEPGPIEERVWPDASLGCPQPGQVYQQVETRGYAIVLLVDEAHHVYHTDLTRLVYCEE